MRLLKQIGHLVIREENLTLRTAMEVLDQGGLKIVLLVDLEGNLSGVLTDGDLRRGILNGYSLDDYVEPIINRMPTATLEQSIVHARELDLVHGVHTILYGRVGQPPQGLFVLDSQVNRETLPPVLVMAGGQGTRLLPLTENTPKPLIEIAGVPILHRILRSLSQGNLRTVYLSVNYLGDKIRDSVGDGSAFGLDIKYVEESQPMGTAGSIGLIRHLISTDNLIVMNADLIIDLDFNQLFDDHVHSSNDITMVVKEHITQVPFGVVTIEGDSVVGIEEKPSQRSLVNAGVYCISNKVLELIPEGYMDMPDLIKVGIASRFKVGAFPIHINWIDIGTPFDLERARSTFEGEN
jgi:dTDP-glucose pyrophosphorylase